MVRLRGAKLRAALSRTAEVAVRTAVPTRLGTVTLHAHQRDALARVESQLARFGGALLAEEVGRGKTFIALAAAAGAHHPLVVIPASLRDAWQLAMSRTGVQCTCVTHESLSAGRTPAIAPDFVVVDESHRFRNPRTRRHRELARITARASVLLLSATPLQNSRADLVAQLSLFLGGAAGEMPDADLANHIIRDPTGDAPGLPRVAKPEWVSLRCDDGEVLEQILSLPSPPRALDAGDAGVLRLLGLVRAWASSRAALRAMLRRRARALAAMEQCVAERRIPTTTELRSWAGSDGDAVQLGFTSLLVSTAGGRETLGALGKSVESEGAALARIHAAMRASPDPDDARVAALRELRACHRAEKVIAFTELASTATAMSTALMADGEVGMLTADRARIASGALTRRELLARFAPIACGVSPPPLRERVSLIVATDLLSEGVNLQDASIVVHLDLPWNPARLTQRMGRVRRPGGREVVRGYLIAPPARAEHLLGVEERLRAKLASAATIVGSSFSVVPVLSREGSRAPAESAAGIRSAESRGEMLRVLAQWRRAVRCASHDAGSDARTRSSSRRSAEPPRPVIAAVACSQRGWIAATRAGRIVASLDGASAAGDCAPEAVALLQAHATRPRQLVDGEARSAVRSVSQLLAREKVAWECGASVPSSPIRGALVRRVGELLAASPRHHRAELISHAAPIRRACSGHVSLGIERELAQLMEDSVSDARVFMARAAAILKHTERNHDAPIEDDIVAIILLGDPQCAQ